MRPKEWIVAVVAFSAGRPRTTLLLAFVVVAAGLLVSLRVRVDSTLSGMLGGGSPSGDALARIVDDFRAADDLLVVVTAPHGPIREGQQRLIRYAARMSRAAAEAPEARGVIEGVRWAPDPSVREFVERVVFPSGALYLDDASMSELLRRLAPGGVREQLLQNEAMLAAPGPEASALAKELVRDPLRLREILQSRLAAIGGAGREMHPLGAAGAEAGGEFSDDGRSLLIRVSGARPVNDIEFSKRMTAVVRDLALRAGPEGIDVRLGGGYAIAATSATMIRSDAIWNTVVSIALIHMFLAFMYRRFIVTPTVIVASAAAGAVVAFGAYALVHPAVTPMSALIASMLAGLGVDYAIHFRSHHESLTARGLPSAAASVRAAVDLAGPAFGAFITTVFGFAAVALAEVRMLRDFAVLGAVGLAGAIVGVLVTLPAALEVLPASGAPARLGPVRALVRLLDRRPLAFVGCSGVLLGAAALSIALTPGFLPAPETDTTTMHPRPNPALELDEFLRERFGSRGDTLLLLVEADSADVLVERCHDAAAALGGEDARAVGVRSTLGLPMLLPDPRVVPRRLAELEGLDADRIIAGVGRAFEESPFDTAQFEGYIAFLRDLLTIRRVPSIGDVRAAPALARLVLPQRPDAPGGGGPAERTVMLVRTPDVSDDAAACSAMVDGVRSLLSGVPGCTLTGVAVVSTDLRRAVRRDLAWSGLVSLGLVVAWLLALFRRPADVILCLVPVVFALVCVFGVMSATGQRLSIVNIVAVPLMAGIAVDCGIFVVSVVRRARAEGRDPRAALEPTIHAVVCTTGTTIIGFATLIGTHTPAVRSLGFASLVGLLASLFGCLFFLVPVLLRYAPRGIGDER